MPMSLRAHNFPITLDKSNRFCLYCDVEGACIRQSVCPSCEGIATTLDHMDPLYTRCLKSPHDEKGKLFFNQLP